MSEPGHVSVEQIAPTAERGWMWRRLYAYLFGLLFTALLAFIIHRLQEPRALQSVAMLVAGLLALTQLFYLGGATLTDIWRLISAVRTSRIVNEARTSNGGADT